MRRAITLFAACIFAVGCAKTSDKATTAERECLETYVELAGDRYEQFDGILINVGAATVPPNWNEFPCSDVAQVVNQLRSPEALVAMQRSISDNGPNSVALDRYFQCLLQSNVEFNPQTMVLDSVYLRQEEKYQRALLVAIQMDDTEQARIFATEAVQEANRVRERDKKCRSGLKIHWDDR